MKLIHARELAEKVSEIPRIKKVYVKAAILDIAEVAVREDRNEIAAKIRLKLERAENSVNQSQEMKHYQDGLSDALHILMGLEES